MLLWLVRLSTDDVEQCAGVGGFGIGAPGNVAVGAHQHQPALVNGKHVWLIDYFAGQWHAAVARRLLEASGGWRVAAQSKQNEAASEQIERRAAILEPDMRRAGAR